MTTVPKELRHEIATLASDPATPVFGGVLRNQDDTLLTRGGGKGLKIYDEIERDCHAYAVIAKRKIAVVAREWQVEPASAGRLDQRAADLVRTQLANLKFDRLCLKLLDATLKGFAVGEILWAVDGAEIVAEAVKVKPQRRFVFDADQQPRLLTLTNQDTGEPLPPRKFIVHRCGEKDDDNPYGLGLGYRLFWPVFFKRQDITFWLTFVDKFASPTTVGEYPPGTPEADQHKLLAATAAVASETGIIIPQGMVLRLLEASRSGIDTYEQLARYMDEQISEAVLGETLSTNIGGTGSLAASQTHNDVRLELAKGDADLLCDTINETLVRWLVEMNVPSACPPKVWRNFAEEEDLKARAETDKLICDMGFEPDEEYINATYGGSGGKWTQKAAPPSPAGWPPPVRFAEAAPADPVDAIVEAALADADGSDMAEVFWRLLKECGSLEEAREKLLDIYDRMTIEPTGAALGDRLFLAGLTGRAEVAAPAAGEADR